MAATPNHRIARQIIELGLVDAKDAPGLQDRVARLQRRVILPRLERWLDAAAPAGHSVRIDRLTIDLGRLPRDGFEQALATAVDRELPQALRQAIAEHEGPEHDGAIQGDLALLERLLATGTLPWWDETRRGDTADAAVARALTAAPSELARMLRQRLRDLAAARRLAWHLHPVRLGALVELLSAGRGGDARRVAAGLVRGWPIDRRRRLLVQSWTAILQTARGGAGDRAGFWREGLGRLALLRGIDVSQLLHELRPHARGEALRLIDAELATLPATPDRARPSAEPRTLATETAVRLKSLIARGAGPLDLLRALQRALDTRPQIAGDLAPLLAEIEQALRRPRDEPGLPRAAGALVQAAARRHWLTRADLLAGIAAWAERPGGLDPGAIRALARSIDAPQSAQKPEHSTASAGSDADGLPVHNAGLVICWPFLRTWMGRLELIEGTAFRSPGHVARAIGLLELVASGDPRPPEYRLALNKVLCGLDPDADWLVDELAEGPPAANERIECDGLLDAVIARAPILGKMSHDGLRGSFLLRLGMLRRDPAGWLLRVERTGYDVVLDRFPWPIGLVKLPWMPAPMQVDW